jgi:DNA (cytosine-5)-methyltransferase 1
LLRAPPSDFGQMLNLQRTIPVIDIFAGPGGLSEGFNSANPTEERLRFSSVLSIEKDPVACATLRLRSFFHQFASRSVPEAYYKVIRGEASFAELSKFPEWTKAGQQVWNTELGKVSAEELHTRIRNKLGGRRDWVLLGGPPCQAYSLVGRARMTGVTFTADARVQSRDVAPSGAAHQSCALSLSIFW